MKYLFKDFLHDKKVYNLNEVFYKRLLKSVTGADPLPFFKAKYGNGKKIYGDHIFSTKFNDRILQIIQREPSVDQPPLKAYVKKWDNQYDMLVLSVQLSEEIKPALKRIIEAWLVEKVSPEEVKRMVPDLTLLKSSKTISYQSNQPVDKPQVVAAENVVYRKRKK
jgi:hypothetical protein